MKKIAYLLAATVFSSFQATFAAEPAGYYAACENQGGKSLLEALHATISKHSTVSYSGLWELYKTSDIDADGKIWDMYSTKRWTPGKEQCGSYSVIGDCYNREHSMPKSWFNDESPMYSDAFHIYPTDGKVNGQRSNYPFGECANGTTVGSKGDVKPLGKLGVSTFEGYSGTVFEPDDQYKGDFARSYFYMAACYNDRIATWKSDMLAKNSFPVFSDWALNVLLKWHRQDPVSQKEIDRNEVVYGQQENRNPFIDHPEMVEYIWGDKSSGKWTSGTIVPTAINSPLDGSTIDMGQMMPGGTVRKTVALKTTGAKTDVLLSSDADVFTVSPASVRAASANAGTDIELTFIPKRLGFNRAVLTIVAGETTALIDLVGTAVDKLPVNGARDITAESFTATWVYAGDDINGNYTIDVRQSGKSLTGYPCAVDARAECHTVTDLDPETTYTYIVKSNSRTSDEVTVTTGKLIPAITFLYEGELTFVAAPGEPSEAEEIMIDAENVFSDFTITVSEPFEISIDKSTWGTSLTLTPYDDRMYMRLYGDAVGSFRTSITAVYGDYTSDNASVTGNIAVESYFYEDFEAAGKGTYDPQTYYGSACRWNLTDAGFWDDAPHGGNQALRGGKSGKAVIEMDEDRSSGIGTVTFYAHKWNNDANTVLTVEYSTDGGQTWTEAGSATLDTKDFQRYDVTVGAVGTARMRLRQTAGKRFILDDLEMTSRTSGLVNPDDLHYRWDAFSRNGQLMVEVKDAEGFDVAVYAIDGTTLFSGHMQQGVHEVAGTTTGAFYIVAAGNTARTVVVR